MSNCELSETMKELAMRVLEDMTNIRLCLRSDENIDCEIYLHPTDFKEVEEMSRPLEPTLWGQRVFEWDRVIPGRPVIVPFGRNQP